MSVRMFRAKIKADKTAEAEKAAEGLFEAIEAAQLEGVKYAWTKLPDGQTFVLVVDLEDDEKNPLLTVPAFKETMDKLKTEWVSEPLAMEMLTTIRSYRLF